MSHLLNVKKMQERTPEEVIQSVVDFYYNSLMLAAQDDILKSSEVLKLNLYEVLSYLSYRLDKADKESQKYKNAVK